MITFMAKIHCDGFQCKATTEIEMQLQEKEIITTSGSSYILVPKPHQDGARGWEVHDTGFVQCPEHSGR